MSSYQRVLRHRSFRYLFLGQSASMVGDRVVVVALALFVTQRTGSPTDLGMVLAANTLPLVALILFGGVWADRLPRHRIMIATDVTRALVHTTVALLIFTGWIAIWQLVVLEAVFGAAQAFFQPAYAGLVPQTVPEELIQDARALTETVANIAFLVGPLLATALVLGIGAGEAFAFDAATFVLSAALLLRVQPRPRGRARPQATMLHDLREGFAEVRSRPWVWVTIVVFSGSVVCVYAQYYALAPIVVHDVYGNVGVFGFIEAAAGIGAVLGGIVALRWRPRRPLLIGMLLTFAWPITDAVLALGAPLAALVSIGFMTGVGFSLLMVWWETALARHIPPRALSRVSAWDWMGSLAFVPVGFLLSGPLAAAVGARTVLGAGSVIGLLLLCVGLLPRSTRELSLDDATGLAPSALPEDLPRELVEEARGEAEVAQVDALVGAVDER